MPDMDMGETIDTDMPFEQAVTSLLNAGKVEEPDECADDQDEGE